MNNETQEMAGILGGDILTLILLIAVIVLIVITVLNRIRIVKLQRSYRYFMSGKNAMSMEQTLIERFQQLDALEAFSRENRRIMDDVSTYLGGTFQKYGLVKYNAFEDQGGKLSFSLALLNQKNDGFIITAMHSREGCFTYIKEIINGNSVLLLAAEEKEALEMALEYGDNR